ncbi:MAG: hypothetical protein WC205_04205 [Opitutaceae bacterium]
MNNQLKPGRYKCPECGEWRDVIDPYVNPPRIGVQVIACGACGKETHAVRWTPEIDVSETLALMRELPALSVRQPWASSIVLCGKPVENRDWPDRYRDMQLAIVRRAGRFLIHAGKGWTNEERHDWQLFVSAHIPVKDLEPMRKLKFRDLPLGGIVGVARFASWVTDHPSPWFMGPGAIVMEDVRPLPFVACKGSLGFFRAECAPTLFPKL